jgi:hypothetical protein
MEFSGEISDSLNDPDLNVRGNWLTKNHAKVLIFTKPVKQNAGFRVFLTTKMHENKLK